MRGGRSELEGREAIFSSGSLLVFSEKLDRGSGFSGALYFKPLLLKESYLRTFRKNRKI